MIVPGTNKIIIITLSLRIIMFKINDASIIIIIYLVIAGKPISQTSPDQVTNPVETTPL